MNELELLVVFHDVSIELETTYEYVFVNIDQNMLDLMRQKFGNHVQMEDLYQLADICIANEWIERTTVDPYYNSLSLTKAGFNMVLDYKYKKNV